MNANNTFHQSCGYSNNENKLLLQAHGLCKAFGGQTVLDGINLSLMQGEIVILRGNNGAGKTTLLNVLTGNLEPEKGNIELFTNGKSEKFVFPKNVSRQFTYMERFTPERLSHCGVSRTWQDVRLFSTQSLRENISVASDQGKGENPLWILLHPLSTRRHDKGVNENAEILLQELGLEGRGNSSADMISLGQSKRVAIARAVHSGAKILFLDEPLAGLDFEGVNEVVNLLKYLVSEKKMTLVIVEHIFNMPKVLDIATTVWTLEHGTLRVETPEKVSTEIENHIENGINSWISNMAGAQGDVITTHLANGAILTRVVPIRTADNRDVILEIDNLIVHRNKRLVIGEKTSSGAFNGISLTVRRGEITILQAPNGWGKTTFFDALAGLQNISSGRMLLNNQEINRLSSWDRHKIGISYLQARNNVFPGLTVNESLRLCKTNEVPLEISKFKNRKVSSLSGGEKQKLALACAVNQQDKGLVLMDEPFSALDIESLDNIWSKIKRCADDCGMFIALPGRQAALSCSK